ncbi:M16 family metallopeptidase [Thiolapillus sp.]
MIRQIFLVSLLLLTGAAQALEIQSWRTAQGTRVMYAHAPQLPMVDLSVLFDAGSARDGALPGKARLLNQLLLEGAGERDADALARHLESRGIEISTRVGRDIAWINMRSLSDKSILTVALDTLAEVIASPRLDADAIARVKERTLAELRLSRQSAEDVAEQMLMQALYGKHPYAHDPLGNESSLASLDAGQLRAFHEQYYTAANAVVAVVGNVDRNQAELLVKRLVGSLEAGEKAAPLSPPEKPKPGIQRKRFPASQTHINMGMLGIRRDDADYFPLLVGNHILGGSGLTSIMGEEVRNKRGLSYGISSRFTPLWVQGPWMLSAQTKNDQAESTRQLMVALLRDFIDEGPDKKQLEAAKKHLVGGFPLKLASNRKILQQIAVLGFYDLPLNWLDTWATKVEQVSASQVRRAFRRRMPVKNLVTVMVGGAKQ